MKWLYVFLICLIRRYYRGNIARIQKVSSGWSVVIYENDDISLIAKTFNKLSNAISHYIKLD